VSALGTFGALAVGAAFGYGAQRGAFCMNSGFRAVLEGEGTKVKALGLAVAVQLLLLPVIFAIGLARPAELPLPLLAAVAGGLLFGSSMRWAGGCAAGVWYKLGAGDIGALLAILGMALGATAADAGPLAPLRVALQQAIPNAASWTPNAAVSVASGLVLLAGLFRLAPGRAGAWDWRTTGLWVGVAAAVAWPASAAAGRNFGLAVVPGTTGLVSGVVGGSLPAWDVWLVLGILFGGWLAARRNGSVTLSAPKPAALVKRFAGGIGLGVGASIATGCTVGQGLTGLALLAPSSLVVMAAIFAGSALATLAARRLEVGLERTAAPASAER
jgi:uncharacterized membrane protein YedE/YeeE